MVRLKVTIVQKVKKREEKFQFLYGAIKSILIIIIVSGYLYFNSSMVRLKGLT